MSDRGVETATRASATIGFDPRRRFHFRQGEPGVFTANVDPAAANVEAPAPAVVARPSGAVDATRRDGDVEEPNPKVNAVAVRENGALAASARTELGDETIGTRATLCRRSRSKAKPCCDGAHVAATGGPPDRRSEAEAPC